MKSSLLVIVLLVGTSWGSWAQERPPRDPIGAGFFPPELLMDNQTALGLTDDQKNVIKGEIQNAQTKFTDIQWKLKKEAEAMEILLRPVRVDEQQALAQLEKVMSLEREIKKTQVALMVRIKNELSAEQQMLLRKIKLEKEDRRRQKPEIDIDDR